MSYQCNLDIFEGPLDLLLHLIKAQKMDIYDITIADITRQMEISLYREKAYTGPAGRMIN